MPYKWTPESERALLLLAFAEVAPPAATIWQSVAEKLGGGLSGSACSQKFYKLKKESEKLLGEDGTATAATTPTASTAKKEKGSARKSGGVKRKLDSDDVIETPTKKKSKKLDVEVKVETGHDGNAQTKVEESND
ncbi:hypothetical protein H2204_001609 [Knufia peltigerae]|uniref:Myb-like domain-containing protein n=1 Tax=Knufia peltigerae TaxID=1002370 RepID=A0AA38YCS2_9EURO|nr:hypothetical protein H2204_001609 [Knufia peltigerae]